MSEPAFPSTNAIATASGVMTQGHPGMTKRELAALLAMQGLCSNPGGPFQVCNLSGWSLTNCSLEEVGVLAAEIADATLKALEGGAQ